MDKKAELQQWLEIADNDLAYAEFASKNMWPVPYGIICFHCQQAAEKYLKRFLVMNNIAPPKVHDLEELLNSVRISILNFPRYLKNAVFYQGMPYKLAIRMK